MLQCIVSAAVVTVTADGLVDQIPSLDLSVAGFHHALDPLVHGIDKGIVHLFLGLRNGAGLIAFELDALDIDIANVVGNMQEHEVSVHGGGNGYLYVLPLCAEGDAEISTATPVAQTTVEIT